MATTTSSGVQLDYTGQQVDDAIRSEGASYVQSISALVALAPTSARVIKVGNLDYVWHPASTQTANGYNYVASEVVGYRPGDVNEGLWHRSTDSATTSGLGVPASGTDGSSAFSSIFAELEEANTTTLVDAEHDLTTGVSLVSTNNAQGFTVSGLGRPQSRLNFEPAADDDILFDLGEGQKTTFKDFWIQGDSSTRNGIGFDLGAGDGASESEKDFSRSLFQNIQINTLDVGVNFRKGWISDWVGVAIQNCADANFRVMQDTGQVNAVNWFGGYVEGQSVGTDYGFDLNFSASSSGGFKWFGTTIEGHFGPEIEMSGVNRFSALYGVYFEKDSSTEYPIMRVGLTSGDDLGSMVVDACSFSGQNEVSFDRVAQLHIRGMATYTKYGQLYIGPNVSHFSVSRPWYSIDDAIYTSTYIQTKRNQTQFPVFTSDLREIDTSVFPISGGGTVPLDDSGNLYLEFDTDVSLDTSTYLSAGHSIKVDESAASTPAAYFVVDALGDSTFFDTWIDNDKIHFVVHVKWGSDVTRPHFTSELVYWNGSAEASVYPSSLSFSTSKQTGFADDKWQRVGFDIDKADVTGESGFEYIRRIKIGFRSINSGASSATDDFWLDNVEVYNAAYGPVYISDATDSIRHPLHLHPRTTASESFRLSSATPRNTVVNTARDLVPPMDTFWTVGTLPTVEFPQAGPTWSHWGSDYATMSDIVLDDGPHGYDVPVWESVSDGVSTQGGGPITKSYTIEPTRTYRVSCYIRATDNLTTDQTIFSLFTPSGENDYEQLWDGVDDSSPRIFAGDLPVLNRWYLVVGHVHRHDATTGVVTAIDASGVYDCTTGEKTSLSVTDYMFDSDHTKLKLLAGFNGSTASVTRQYYKPSIVECDGNEPSIASLMKEPVTQSALTAADGSTVDGTYGTEEADVISNNVTRIGEIEDALKAYGILPS